MFKMVFYKLARYPVITVFSNVLFAKNFRQIRTSTCLILT